MEINVSDLKGILSYATTPKLTTVSCPKVVGRKLIRSISNVSQYCTVTHPRKVSGHCRVTSNPSYTHPSLLLITLFKYLE
jgi:hypothetical protein